MKFIEFYNYFQNYPLLERTEIKKIFPDLDPRRLHEWQQKGYLAKVANNFYIFPNKELREEELKFIANRLYRPSYLSLEFALAQYSLIPEAVFGYSSITTRKTKNISTDIGNFDYRKIKRELFFGYNIVVGDKVNYKLAEPEKALLDLLYLRTDIKTEKELKDLRINHLAYQEEIDQEKLKRYLAYFDSRTLEKKIDKLNNIL